MTTPATNRRRTRRSIGGGNSSKAQKRPKPSLDLAQEIIESESSASSSSDDDIQNDEDDSIENLDAKKVRMAREYLQQLKAAAGSDTDEESSSNNDASETSYERVSRRLQTQRLTATGTLEQQLADRVEARLQVIHDGIDRAGSLDAELAARQVLAAGHVSWLPRSGHDHTPTGVALVGPNMAVSTSKDHSVVLWDVAQQRRLCYLAPDWQTQAKKNGNETTSRTDGEVLCVAGSDDGRYAAVGLRNGTCRIYNVLEQTLIKTFTGHKGAVTACCFCTHSSQTLFTGSTDRCIRHYSLPELMYLETLYGHQFGVTDLDCHISQRPVSVGLDRTARVWKIAEESHLIYRGGGSLPPAQCVTMIHDDWFLTGHDDGTLCLWMSGKKRAVARIECAHGVDPSSQTGRAIVSLTSVKGSDVVASGSYDGNVRFWRVRTGSKLQERGLGALGTVPVYGYVNAMQFAGDASFLLVAQGQEHRMGRWQRIPRAKNRIAVVKLLSTKGAAAADDVDGPPSAKDQSSSESDEESSSSSDNDELSS